MSRVTEIDKAFSNYVKQARKNRPDKSQFTGQTIADAAGINRETYSRKETKKSPWTLSEAIKILKTLGIESIKITEIK